ncbi:MAG TPA: hypothetical protein VF049_15855 [Nocardioidaceae bacterium]
MRIRRTVTALVSLGTAALPLLAVPPASATDYTADTSTVILASRTDLAYHDTLVLKGAVQFVDETTGEAHSLGGSQVTLSRQWRGSDAWRKIATTTTRLQDNVYVYTFKQTVTRNATYRVSYAGETRTSPDGLNTVTFAPSQASRKVWVGHKVTGRFVEPRPHHVFIKGTATPYAGKVVYLQRKTCKACRFKAYDKVRTSRTGVFRFPVDFPRTRTSWWYRVKVPASTRYAVTYSKLFRAYAY